MLNTKILAGNERLVLFFADFLPIPFTSESFFDALLLAWFQVERVTLDFLDDVFRLHLTLETAQSILQGLAFLHTNFCQVKYTSQPAKPAISLG
jgi:uncharacterized protein (DUF697 family)